MPRPFLEDSSGEADDTSKEAVPRIAREIDAEIALFERKLAELKKEMVLIEAQLEQLRNARRAFEPVLISAPLIDFDSKEPILFRRGGDAETIRTVARLALLESGRPLNRTELLRWINKKGVKLTSKKPLTRIGKVLWAAPEFIHLKEGYWLAGEPKAGS